MSKSTYIPEAGDVVWMDFCPQTGHEQAGRRPALVLSDSQYNQISGLMVCCPMTTHIKGYPFEVIVSDEPPSVVLADHIKNLDWRARNAVFKERASEKVLAETRAKIITLIGCSWLLEAASSC